MTQPHDRPDFDETVAAEMRMPGMEVDNLIPDTVLRVFIGLDPDTSAQRIVHDVIVGDQGPNYLVILGALDIVRAQILAKIMGQAS